MWHLRLGHIELERIKKLVKEGPLASLQVGSLSTYKFCLEGKITKRPFNAKGNRANECREPIHSNVCRLFNIQVRGGYEYFVTFTNDYSRYGYVYLMRCRFDTFENIKEYRVLVEK